MVGRAESVGIVEESTIVFLDAGENFETVRCNACQRPLDSGWWSARMTAAHTSEFESLEVACPLCSTDTSLNELVYDWPQGFAVWRLEAMNPETLRLGSDDLATLGECLGGPLRQIIRRI